MSTTDLSHAAWHKSRRSAQEGSCVEVADVWRKSSRSAQEGECVEVAILRATEKA